MVKSLIVIGDLAHQRKDVLAHEGMQVTLRMHYFSFLKRRLCVPLSLKKDHLALVSVVVQNLLRLRLSEPECLPLL